MLCETDRRCATLLERARIAVLLQDLLDGEELERVIRDVSNDSVTADE